MYTPGKITEAWLGEVKNVTVDAAFNGTRQLVAAVAGAKIIVLAGWLICSGAAMDAVFKSATTALTGTIELAVGSIINLPFNEAGWLQTEAAEALNVTLGDHTPGLLSGWLRYIEV